MKPIQRLMKRGDQYIRTLSVDRDRHDLQSFYIKLELGIAVVIQSAIPNSKNRCIKSPTQQGSDFSITLILVVLIINFPFL